MTVRGQGAGSLAVKAPGIIRIVGQLALGCWCGAIVMTGVTAALAFPTMRRAGVAGGCAPDPSNSEQPGPDPGPREGGA